MAENLDDDVRALHAGELSAFVAGRDALAKRLRADGRVEDAATVKALRKPSRAAWVLDRAAAAEPKATAALVAAAAAAGRAQEGGGDVRAATADLRDAVRRLAGAAPAPAAATADLVAVVADPRALEELAAGRLAVVPEGGGFGPLPLTDAAPARRDGDDGPDQRAAAKARREAEAVHRRAQAARDRARAAHTKAVDRREAAEAAEQQAAGELAAAEAAVDEAAEAAEALG